MSHDLEPAYEPVGSHGMNYRRQCRKCKTTFVLHSPDEEVLTPCLADLPERDTRVVGKHPSLAAPYGGGTRRSARLREAPESSSEVFEYTGAASGPAQHPMTLVLSIQRADGLTSTRLIDGLELERARYPEDIIRLVFGRVLENFIRDARDMEERE